MQGQTIWLVGASEGIGRALAVELASRGARVVISARNVARLQEVLTELPGQGHHAVAVDVTDAMSVQQAWQEVLQYGDCDGVVFNAGIYYSMPIDGWNLQQAEQTMDVNFNGALRITDAVLKYFRARKAGRLMFVSSVAAYRGLPKSLAYGASKAALTNFVESLKLELMADGITVQLVSPGFVKTRLTDQNNFTMPMMVSPEFAAKKIADGMADGRYEIHFPLAFSYFLKLLRVLPNRVFFFLAGKL
jgi:short-subunit dehydrogenase